ncbi:toxin glutamine deamidase domain-containing protein [Streptomyces sp. NPDC003710]
MTPVPIHTVLPGATPPPHATSATPQPPGAPHADPGTSTQQHPHQDSLDDIRNDLDHYPGGLTEPHPDDQHALVNAVPHNPDGTPQRFPDPFGHWSQLQNDGGNQVPGRSNNCADCSRSFLETWYGNPQVSAPRTLDFNEHGNPDLWSPENNANANQIRWAGAEHTYAGTGSDPDTPARIAWDLHQAGHGAAAIVQVDWPGGGGHAFNAVNYHGNIVWIDTQSGEVSHQPLHIPNADRVWHIPLDANRNPIHPTPTDTTTSHNESDNPQEGTGTHHQESDNSPESNENHKAPEPDPSDKASKQTPDETDTNPEATTTPNENSSDDTDRHTEDSSPKAERGPTHADTPKPDGPSTRHPSESTHESGPRPTRPTAESSNGYEGDHATPPTRGDERVPDNATRTDAADTRTTPRTADPTPEHQAPSPTDRSGNTDTRPVTNDTTPPGPHRAPTEPTTDRGLPRQSPAPDLRTNETAPHQPPSGSANGPGPGATPSAGHHATPNQPSAAPTGPHHGAPQEPAGEGPSRFHAEEVRGSAEFGERQTATHTHFDMPLEESQRILRETHHVSQTDLGPVIDNVHRWARDGSLARVVEEARNNGRLSQSQLNKILGEKFRKLNPEQKMAVVAGIARISNTFHEAHAAGNSPIAGDPERRRPKGVKNEINPLPGVSMHENHDVRRMKEGDSKSPADARARDYAVTHEADSADPADKEKKENEFEKLWKQNKDGNMRPDMSGKNYAVLEVHEQVGDRVEVNYVIDSSIPGSDRYHHDHSEPHLGEWMRSVEASHPGRFKTVALFTEFEPCGDRTGTGGANCSDYLSHDMERDPGAPRARTKTARENRPEEVRMNPPKSDLRISYGIGYRKGAMGHEAAAQQGEYASPAEKREAVRQGKALDNAEREHVKALTDEQMVKYRGEWLRAWMNAVGPVQGSS